MELKTKAVRVIYRKATNSICWTYELNGRVGHLGKYPISVEDYLNELPTRELIGNDGQPIDGSPDDYACIEEADRAVDFLGSDENQIVDGQIVIGEPRPVVEPVQPRNPLTEIDELKAKIALLESR